MQKVKMLEGRRVDSVYRKKDAKFSAPDHIATMLVNMGVAEIQKPKAAAASSNDTDEG